MVPHYFEFEMPRAGTEAEHIAASLNRLRTTFRYKTDELDAAALRQRLGPSTLTLGGLLKHMAIVETLYFDLHLRDAPMIAPWDDFDLEEGWESSTDTGDFAPADLYRLYDDAVANSLLRLEEALVSGGLDQRVGDLHEQEPHRSLRSLLMDLVEEYGRHTGHADLLRENVDGRVGEDVPELWRPLGAIDRG